MSKMHFYVMTLIAAVVVACACSPAKRPADEPDGAATDTDTDTGSGSDTDTATDTGTDTGTGADTQCVGKDDFTLCDIVTNPDRSYDICIAGICQSPGCGTEECNPPGPHFPLSDTNQRLCYNDMITITCPASGETFYGQDAQYGWDTVHTQNARFTRDTTAANHPMVLDNVTGLIWQGCAMGLSGDNCSEGSPATVSWSDALAYCDGVSWGGHDDWRLPDRYELHSIVDYGRHSPSIDIAAFPETPINTFITSSSYPPSYPYGSFSWSVVFESGRILGHNLASSSNSVRCVRGSPSPRPARFTRDLSTTGQPVVFDNATGLVWQGCAMGLSGDDCSEGTVAMGTWSQALSGCEGLSWGGHEDWRLPSAMELPSIVDDRVYDSSIDADAFPATPWTERYWTSSSDADNMEYAWDVRFYTGTSGNVFHKTYARYVRCVRL